MDQRFEKIYSQSQTLGTESIEIWLDKSTGVQYLYRRSGYGGGLTPLLDPEGKPFILDV